MWVFDLRAQAAAPGQGQGASTAGRAGCAKVAPGHLSDSDSDFPGPGRLLYRDGTARDSERNFRTAHTVHGLVPGPAQSHAIGVLRPWSQRVRKQLLSYNKTNAAFFMEAGFKWLVTQCENSL